MSPPWFVFSVTSCSQSYVDFVLPHDRVPAILRALAVVFKFSFGSPRETRPLLKRIHRDAFRARVVHAILWRICTPVMA